MLHISGHILKHENNLFRLFHPRQEWKTRLSDTSIFGKKYFQILLLVLSPRLLRPQHIVKIDNSS